MAPAVALATDQFAEVQTGSVNWKFLRAKKSKLRALGSHRVGAKVSAPGSRIAFSNVAFAPQQLPILTLPNFAPGQREPSKFHLY
jgi:hypothetical protein